MIMADIYKFIPNVDEELKIDESMSEEFKEIFREADRITELMYAYENEPPSDNPFIQKQREDAFYYFYEELSRIAHIPNPYPRPKK